MFLADAPHNLRDATLSLIIFLTTACPPPQLFVYSLLNTFTLLAKCGYMLNISYSKQF